jgi:prevent-host-death family protein
MGTWQLQDAKARFSEFLDAAIEKGPQVVTRRGVEAAVLVPIEEWRRMKQSNRPTLKDLLLGDGHRFDLEIHKRTKWKLRQPIDFSGPEYK